MTEKQIREGNILIANAPVLRKIVNHLADLHLDYINLDEVKHLVKTARDNL